MHEVFLCRVAAHPVLRKDLNFHVFLEYNQDVSRIPTLSLIFVLLFFPFCLLEEEASNHIPTLYHREKTKKHSICVLYQIKIE